MGQQKACKGVTPRIYGILGSMNEDIKMHDIRISYIKVETLTLLSASHISHTKRT